MSGHEPTSAVIRKLWATPLAAGRSVFSGGRRRLTTAARRAWLALQRDNTPRIAALAIGLLVLGATAVYLNELAGDAPTITSWGEALWYAIVTMTTVGYGDYTPKTTTGRLVGVFLMLGGMSLLSVFTATVASVLVARKIKEGRGLQEIKLKNHVLVCGWNQYAERVLAGVCTLTKGQMPVVLVNELPEESVNEILFRDRDADLRYVHGDPASEAVLLRASVRQARAAIVLADTSRPFATASDERTTLVTLALKSLKPDIKVTAEALDLKSEAHLRRAGADDIVISGEFNGFLLSSATMAPGISQVVRQLLSHDGAALRRELVPPELVGHTFGELCQALRARHGFLTLAIVTDKRGLTLDDLLRDDYSLVDQFIRQQFKEAGREYLRYEEGAVRLLVNPPDSYVIGQNDAAICIARSM